MASWKPEELASLRRHEADRATSVTLNALQQLLPNRSRVAIKKKFLDMKAGRPAAGQQAQGEGAAGDRPPPPRSVAWAPDELERLEREYGSVLHLGTKKARVEAIIGGFPGRSIKAVETKLRESYATLYNTRTGGQPPSRVPEMPSRTPRRPRQLAYLATTSPPDQGPSTSAAGPPPSDRTSSPAEAPRATRRARANPRPPAEERPPPSGPAEPPLTEDEMQPPDGPAPHAAIPSLTNSPPPDGGSQPGAPQTPPQSSPARHLMHGNTAKR